MSEVHWRRGGSGNGLRSVRRHWTRWRTRRKARGARIWYCNKMKLSKRHKNFGSVMLAANPEAGARGRAAAILVNTKHGMRNTSEYTIWRGIKKRCLLPTDTHYALYGGRGIKLFPAWIDDFMAFYNYVGARPSKRHSIDRYPDKNGNYEPGNVRWANQKQQLRNTRVNVILEFNGKSQTVIEWSEELGISQYAIYQRLDSGWSTERTLTEPAKHGRRPSAESKYPNVAFHKKTGKYFAYRGAGKKRRYAGSFSTAEEAAKHTGIKSVVIK